MGLSVILAQQLGESTCYRHPATGDRYPPPHGEYTSHPQPSHGKIPVVLHQTSVIIKFAAVFSRFSGDCHSSSLVYFFHKENKVYWTLLLPARTQYTTCTLV